MSAAIAFVVGLVVGGLLGYVARGVLDGLPNGEASPHPTTVGAPPQPDWGYVCALVDATDRVVSYRQVKTVPPEFVRYHGRNANRRFVRDGEDVEGRPRFRLVS